MDKLEQLNFIPWFSLASKNQRAGEQHLQKLMGQLLCGDNVQNVPPGSSQSCSHAGPTLLLFSLRAVSFPRSLPHLLPYPVMSSPGLTVPHCAELTAVPSSELCSHTAPRQPPGPSHSPTHCLVSLVLITNSAFLDSLWSIPC